MSSKPNTEHATRRHDREPDPAEKVRRAIDLVPDGATRYEAREGLAGLEAEATRLADAAREAHEAYGKEVARREEKECKLRKIRDLLDPDAPGHAVREAYELADEALEGTDADE